MLAANCRQSDEPKNETKKIEWSDSYEIPVYVYLDLLFIHLFIYLFIYLLCVILCFCNKIAQSITYKLIVMKVCYCFFCFMIICV